MGTAGKTGATVNYTVSAVDDCDPNPTVVCNPPSGTFFHEGTTPVNCTARDKCGNGSECSFTVRVIIDTTPPRLTCPSNIVVNCDGTNATRVAYTVTAVDDCDADALALVAQRVQLFQAAVAKDVAGTVAGLRRGPGHERRPGQADDGNLRQLGKSDGSLRR